jgi:hypothetical protein
MLTEEEIAVVEGSGADLDDQFVGLGRGCWNVDYFEAE